MLAVTPGPTYLDAQAAYQGELLRWEPIVRRITDLFLRMQTKQAEVAATVHFTAHSLARLSKGKPTEMEVLDAATQWKQKRRPPLEKAEIASSIRHLNLLGWIDAQPSPNLPVPEDELITD
jgi:hypothetical protein